MQSSKSAAADTAKLLSAKSDGRSLEVSVAWHFAKRNVGLLGLQSYCVYTRGLVVYEAFREPC